MGTGIFLTICGALFMSLFSSPAARGQSLADVLSSLQERKLLLEQKSYVVDYLSDVALGNPTGGYPAPELITWGTLTDFPDDSATSGLTIPQRLELLNQAVKAFDELKVGFLNVSSQRLADANANGVIELGLFRDFTEFDLASPSLVTPDNYRQKLQELALKTSKLRVVSWPVLGEWVKLDGLKTIDSNGSGHQPLTIDIENLTQQTYGGPPKVIYYGAGGWGEYASVSGEYYSGSGGFKETKLRAEIQVVKELTYREAPDGWTDSVSGDSYVVSRRRYRTANEVAVDSETSPDDWESVLVVHKFTGDDDLTLHASMPEFSVTGTWQARMGVHDVNLGFTPSGCSLADALADKNYSAVYGGGGAQVEWHVFRRDYSLVFAADFSRGLDATGNDVLDRLEDLPPGAPASGSLVVTPDPGLMFAIDLGVGERGGTAGAIGVYHPGLNNRRDAPSPDQYLLNTQGELDPAIAGPSLYNAYQVGYPSLASDVRFIGASEDFVLFHEGDRVDPPNWDELVTDKHKGWFAANFASAWEAPRLRQIVGRTLIADFSYQADRFTTTIALYRRLPDDALGDLTAPVDVSEMTALTSYKIEPNSTFDADGLPNSWFSLKVSEPTVREWLFDPLSVASDYDEHEYTIEWREGTSTIKSRTFVADDAAGTVVITDTEGSVTMTTVTFDKGDVSYPDPFGGGGGPPFGVTLPEDNVLDPGFALESITRSSGGQDLIHAFTPNARYPESLTVTDPINPDQSYAWIDGLPTTISSGNWNTVYTMESGDLKGEHRYNTARYATTWTTWNNQGEQEVVYSAPDGTVTSKNATEADSLTIDYYEADDTAAGAIPWAAKETTRKDGTGSTHRYTLTAGALQTVIEAGQKTGATVSVGLRIDSTVNEVGLPSSRIVSEIGGVTLDSLSWGDFTSWGAPKEVVSQLQSLTSSWDFDGEWQRLSTSEDVFGVETTFDNYDALDRLTVYTWDNDKEGAVAYNGTGIGVVDTLTVPGLGNRGGSMSFDGLGNVTGASREGGRPLSYSVGRSGGEVTTTLNDSVAGRNITSVLRQEDNTLVSQAGSVTTGNTGAALAVQGGLLTRTITSNGLEADTTIQTDGWGRTRKVTAPDDSGAVTDTTYSYSNPGDAVKRVTVEPPSGRVHVQESDPYDANGAVRRWGLKKTGTGAFVAADRYWESRSTATGTTVETILFQNEDSDLREVMRSNLTPSTGVVVLSITEGEQTITRTPDYTARTMTTSSSRGWTSVAQMDEHGQLDEVTPGGTGAPAMGLDPVFRADGTLQQLTFSDGSGDTVMAFDVEGKLTALTTPELGAVTVSHSFANGGDDLTINGDRIAVSGNGLSVEQSGENVFDHDRTTTLTAATITEQITPTGGGGLAGTTYTANAAGASIAKDYSGPDDTSTTWLAGGRLDEHTLGRGAQINYAYTADQFLDLWKIDYPALNSGPFSVSSITEEFGYDTAGRINSISDQSGARDLDYEKDRLVETDYTGGALNPYTVKRLYADGVGRQTGLVVERDGVAIHSATYSYSGDSSEPAQVVSGGITSVFERDGGAATGPRLLTRVTRGAVQQQYTRDTNAGGRITHANSNGTTSAPTFHYSDFDSHGRRETCATSNGSWDWDYSDGQLQSASNATLGTFQYTYDASGRRTAYQVPGSGPLNSTLNDLGQFQTLPRDQQYSLFIEAAAGADLWINGQQMPSPTFPYYFEKTTGFPSGGGWEHWNLLAVLPGAGEPGAAPDAKSELEGYVWIPPLSETMTHDADGNRQSSAQWDYGWDGRNRLIAARTKDHLTAAKGWDLEFDYDAEGRRFKKVVRCYESGQLVEDKTITFVWDGWDLVYERHEDSNQELLLERKYAWGLDISGTRGGAGGAGGLLAIEEIQWNGVSSTSTTVLPLYDGSGHVVGLANTAGTLLAEYWWGPFGELIEASGPMANSNPWRYATKYHDVETGLSYFGHRYYDPTTGQWMSREPLGEGESLNLYAYCGNDGINKVDVRGLKDKWITDPKNPVSALADGSNVINLVWWVDSWFGDDYIDQTVPGTTRPFGSHFFDDELWVDCGDGQYVAGAGNQVVVDASRIAEDRFHLSTHAKIGTVAMGAYSIALVAVPAATAYTAYGGGSLYAAGYVSASEASMAITLSPWGLPVAGGVLTTGALLLDGEDPGSAVAAGAITAFSGRVGDSRPINWSRANPANWHVLNPANYRMPLGQFNMGVPVPQYVGPKTAPMIGQMPQAGQVIGSSTTRRGQIKIEYLFQDKNAAMNWARQQLGHGATRYYDSSGKWIGWRNSSGDKVHWGHGDWGGGTWKINLPTFEL